MRLPPVRGELSPYSVFLAYFELAMELMHARWEVEKPAFLYKLDTVTGG